MVGHQKEKYFMKAAFAFTAILALCSGFDASVSESDGAATAGATDRRGPIVQGQTNQIQLRFHGHQSYVGDIYVGS